MTDNGTDVSHEDLQRSLWTNPKEIADNGIDDDGNNLVDDINGWNFSGNSNRLKGGDHGTHTVGDIVATKDNGVGVTGLAPGVRAMPIKWDGEQPWTSAVIAASYMYAANQGARIVSTSYNIDRWPGDRVVEQALEYMEQKGMLHFNSAGNSNREQPTRTKLTNVVLVASTEAGGANNDKKSSFSNYGTGIDIAAPGTDILSTINDNRYGRLSGTSMAAPKAAAVAALVWSRHPEWNREQVYAQVAGTADPIDSVNPTYAGKLGRGRINAYRALTETVPPPTLSATQRNQAVVVTLQAVLDTSSANNPNAWRIETANGTVVRRGAPEPVRIATNELIFDTRDLPKGRYRLVASAEHLRDPFGQPLNGNPNGGDFVFTFEI